MKRILAVSAILFFLLPTPGIAQAEMKALHTLSFYEAPDKTSNVIDTIPAGGRFRIVKWHRGYWRAAYSGKSGYVKDEYAKMIDVGKVVADIKAMRADTRPEDTALTNPMIRAAIMTDKVQNTEKEHVYKNAEKEGLLINDCAWQYSKYYSNFVDVSFSCTNYGKKTLKYITVYVSAKNSVNDLISHLGKTVFKLKAVGPVEPLKKFEAVFDNVLYTTVMHDLVIKKVELLYMDGSVKTLTNPKEIML